ncbi:sigma-54-dependent transcriptional regulator [Thermodesulfobacteriota bacterium]
MSGERILVVDDEAGLREMLSIALEDEGFKVRCASSATEAMPSVEEGVYDLIISDIRMPGMDGIEFLGRIKQANSKAIVVMITAHGSMETAVQAMREGAYDYITKPFKVEKLKRVIANALENRRLAREVINLKRELGDRYEFSNIVGSSDAMQKVFDLIRRVSATKSNILISGESGTGKELVAKAIHFNSDRKDDAFVTINCGAIPETLIESELFGHVKGSFTGAIDNKPGIFETAHEGTAFLDEIGELPLQVQVKFLRAIQEKSFRRVGGTEDLHSDFRIICATNKDLEKEVGEGRFREDLFYRLNVIQIHTPPLRDRREDIPLLAAHFLEKYAAELDRRVLKISNQAMEVLQQHRYPGNVRELENVIERCVALETSEIILPETLPPALTGESPGEPRSTYTGPGGMHFPDEGINLEEMVEDFEKGLILEALKRTDGVKKRAARLLKISFRSFRYRLEKYGLGNGGDSEGRTGDEGMEADLNEIEVP